MNRYFLIPVLCLSLWTFLACDQESCDPLEGVRISQVLLDDFYSRNPGATISETYFWSQDNRFDIVFTDNDGIPGMDIYDGGTWLMTQKEYDKASFKDQIPFIVAMAYLDTGVSDEEYDSDNDYVVEISRNGMDGKQYEFHFTSFYQDGKRTFEHLSHHIVIGEDGTILAHKYGSFNRSEWWYDIRASIAAILKKYPDAKLLGSVNDAGNNVFFIMEGGILKTATVRHLSDWEWEETRFPLPLGTPLPESAMAKVKEYSSTHGDIPLSAVFHVEDRWGEYYGLRFGDDLENTTIYSQID